MNRILRLPKVLDATGLGRTALYNHVAGGTFTRPVKLGARSIGWPEDEVAAINAARIAGKSDPEIRELVKTLHAKRGQS